MHLSCDEWRTRTYFVEACRANAYAKKGHCNTNNLSLPAKFRTSHDIWRVRITDEEQWHSDPLTRFTTAGRFTHTDVSHAVVLLNK